MLTKSTPITYAFLTILSTGRKNFENMRRASKTTGRTVASLLQSSDASIAKMHKISQLLFAKKKSFI